ncbi:hypothetical protein J4727_07285 [Providencia rettgeri]|uniref:Uncharacterized protein n=1 Tax=Providencia rettgeri TaxID=587 RepID=A0A939NGY7_PRORE|nr:hypothetical protein [Providencia rettgeri]
MQGKGEIYSTENKIRVVVTRSDCNGAIFWRCELAEQNCPAWRLGTLKIAPHILTLKQTAVAKVMGYLLMILHPANFQRVIKRYCPILSNAWR